MHPYPSGHIWIIITFTGVSDVVQESGQMLFNGICDTCVVFNFKIILTINHKSGVIFI